MWSAAICIPTVTGNFFVWIRGDDDDDDDDDEEEEELILLRTLAANS